MGYVRGRSKDHRQKHIRFLILVLMEIWLIVSLEFVLIMEPMQRVVLNGTAEEVALTQ